MNFFACCLGSSASRAGVDQTPKEVELDILEVRTDKGGRAALSDTSDVFSRGSAPVPFAEIKKAPVLATTLDALKALLSSSEDITEVYFRGVERRVPVDSADVRIAIFSNDEGLTSGIRELGKEKGLSVEHYANSEEGFSELKGKADRGCRFHLIFIDIFNFEHGGSFTAVDGFRTLEHPAYKGKFPKISATDLPVPVIGLARKFSLNAVDSFRYAKADAAYLFPLQPSKFDEICHYFYEISTSSTQIPKNFFVKVPTRPTVKAREFHVAVVDDDLFIRNFAVQFIQNNFGFQTYQFADGPSAVEGLKTRAVHLVLMDNYMPKSGDGIEATRQIREYEKENSKPPVPIVAVTGDLGRGVLESFRDAGASGAFEKPHSLDKISKICYYFYDIID